MAVVHYVGSSDFRTITTANFVAGGVSDQTTVTFSVNNNWQVTVSATANTFLLTFPDFASVGVTRPVSTPGTDFIDAAELQVALAAQSATYVPKGLVDAAGDLLVGTADNTVGRLAKGTDGQVLSVTAGAVGWAAGGGGSGLPATQTGPTYTALNLTATSETEVAHDLWRFTPALSTLGPFRSFFQNQPFNGVRDPMWGFGYNADQGGGLVKSGEMAFAFNIESHYYDATRYNLEAYFQFTSKTGFDNKRPFFWQFDKDDGRFVEFDLRSSGVRFTDWGGVTRTVTNGVLNSTATITSATAVFVASDVGSTVTGSGIPAGAQIKSVTNATTAVLSVAATATASGVALTFAATEHLVANFTHTLGSPGLSIYGMFGQTGQTAFSVASVGNQGASLALGGGVGGVAGVSLTVSPISTSTWQFQVGTGYPLTFSQSRVNINQVPTPLGALSAQVTVADKDTAYSLYLRAQTAQGTQLVVVHDATAANLLWYVDVDGTQHFHPGGVAKLAVGTTGVGFFGAAQSAKRAATADATDLASVITLANALKADLVAYGLKS